MIRKFKNVYIYISLKKRVIVFNSQRVKVSVFTLQEIQKLVIMKTLMKKKQGTKESQLKDVEFIHAIDKVK